ncbi:S41 family peptidase [Flavobacterium sp. K5-23]|uniref:S41 family peptidase n=1 Tax=Flavobacterium sp. K5-23 TaxID=2746225 RepID=UPI00200E3FDB|nr:S41 family peptidase [Flavobacterium sp. K5-23]UQD57309.1 PDZ domain-containing protein [Flavobacterium sp. K5-23]
MGKSALILFFTTFSLFAQNDVKTCEILSKINTLILREHIQPKPIDDSLSVFVFDSFMDELDPSRNIFLKSEYDGLVQKYRKQIDDNIKNKNCSFLTEIITVYKSNLLRNKTVLEKINLSEIDFELIDTIRFYKKQFPFYMLENQVEKVWTKKIRYEILDDIASTSKNLDSLKVNFNAMAIVSKNAIIQKELCKINTLLESPASYDESIYNHFCRYFDPHTSYFSNDSKSSFVASLSNERLSLGMVVNLNEKNEIIIHELDPKGPAFQTGKIKKGDQIISISNQKETLQVSCSSLESISNMIQSETNKEIVLTLKRNSSNYFEVPIEKKILKDESDSVYSFIVEKNKKIGYIKIPGFYGDFEGESGKGCAEDVAKEIFNLQKENVKGLVIDLSDNGGGSMEEAIKLAGIFVDKGPISIIIDNKQTQTIIEDPFFGMLYKDPIVLMINSSSASASEFFASILQDYNRAILVGTPTLGKATMQSIRPLEEYKDDHFLKITINKFYRITGKSHQKTGVNPDVYLPEFYENIYQKEKDQITAFKNDSIETPIYIKPYIKPSLIQKIALKNNRRIDTISYFNEIKIINTKLNSLNNNPKRETAMTLDSVFNDQKAINSLFEEISSFESKKLDLNIYNSDLTNLHLNFNLPDKENNQLRLKALKTNHYLGEAIQILEDFITLK